MLINALLLEHWHVVNSQMMLIIKICFHTYMKVYVCLYTCQHFNMRIDLLNICRSENSVYCIVLSSILVITVRFGVF